MLEQALTVLAAAGGTAVVQAAGTDAWTGLRQAVARWFGRGDSQRERAELERLDRTVGELETAETAVAERERTRHEAAWQARFEALLESLDETAQAQAAEELRILLNQHTSRGAVSAGQGGLAAGGDIDIHAEGGSIAAGVNQGGAYIGRPPTPDPSQG
ncbi:hypothetical protein [Streptomyces olivochromogenes]|uniref:Uncharacterized protein n=1 Tax=Streptomyces olivochromogenes TaxID=1963 RepID=A0A286PGB2_STROL|nr:hypothetical protein [Streptomyces olivochromogenes]KUN34954.1 hypothetical protein AQJ27_48900 [Streptomyces olivochromogenes]GAX58591.1 hypothetical protein SO3561_10165 [Streptomyces olivochromogenes]